MPSWESIVDVLNHPDYDIQTKTEYVTDLCRLADFAYPLLKKIIHSIDSFKMSSSDMSYILQFIDLYDDMSTYYHMIYHMIRKKMDMETIFIPFVLSQFKRARLSDFIYSTREKKGWEKFKSGLSQDISYFKFMKENILGSEKIHQFDESRVFV